MVHDFTIRLARLSDEKAVDALLWSSNRDLLASHYDPAGIEAALPVIGRANPDLLSSDTYYLAEAGDGLLVGCGGWSIGRPGTGETVPGLAHLRHFAVHPDWAGQGIGRAIFARCCDDLRGADVGRLECYASLNAEGFYEALGFRAVRRTTLTVADGAELPVIVMERTI